MDGPIFDVTTYGAVADDDTEDVSGIQAAIDAAADAGGGVVFFPPGRFLVNELQGLKTPRIRISAGDTVLRGSGAEEGGTELFMRYNLEPTNPDQMWTTQYVIDASGSTSSSSGSPVTTLTKGNRREEFVVTVADASSLRGGDRIILYLKDPAAVTDDLLSPYAIESEWTRLKSGELALERHQIEAISGSEVTLREPLHQTVDAQYNWEVRKFEAGERLGIEDLAFIGNWKQEFVHHESALHDGGWSALSVSKYSNSWLRRLRFVDWNTTIKLGAVSGSTVADIEEVGNRGHSSIHINNGSYGVLVTNYSDKTNNGQWHSAGVSILAAGNVFQHMSWPATTTFDAHGVFPYATLFDQVKGGLCSARSGSGGAQSNIPQHMRHLVFWNFDELGQKADNFRFWQYPDSKWGRFYLPLVIGFHGATSTFDESQLELIESHGEAVKPASLYDAQLELRLARRHRKSVH